MTSAVNTSLIFFAEMMAFATAISRGLKSDVVISAGLSAGTA
jgi:hypothetical protein